MVFWHFSINFCPFKSGLSGNTVWSQTSVFQKLTKNWSIFGIFIGLHWFNAQRQLWMNFIDSMDKDYYGWTSLIQCTKIIMDELHWFNGQRFNLCRQSLLLEKFKLIIFWNMWVSYVKLQGSIWKDNLRWADDWGKRQTHFATETDDMEVGLEPDSTLCCCFSFKATTTYVVVHFSKSITGI